jgi:hypothetical protein
MQMLCSAKRLKLEVTAVLIATAILVSTMANTRLGLVAGVRALVNKHERFKVPSPSFYY